MSKNSPQAPTPPNPAQVAASQTGINRAAATDTAALNRVNQSGPYGTSSYRITGYSPDGTPIYSQSSQLSAPEQALLNQQQGNQQLAGQVGRALLGGAGGTQQAIQDAENAAYNTQAQYLRPQQAEQTQQLQDHLVNQGLQPGTPAYEQAMGDLTRQQTFQNQAALNAAVTAGQQEQNTLFGQGMGLFNYAQPASLNFSSVPSASVNPADYSADAYNSYQGQLNTYNAQMGAQNSMNTGLFGLLGAGVQGALGNPKITSGASKLFGF